MERDKLRLGTTSPLDPARWNKEQTISRTLSRSVGQTAVRALDEQLSESIAAKIERIKADARRDIVATAANAENKINKLLAQEAKRTK